LIKAKSLSKEGSEQIVHPARPNPPQTARPQPSSTASEFQVPTRLDPDPATSPPVSSLLQPAPRRPRRPRPPAPARGGDPPSPPSPGKRTLSSPRRAGSPLAAAGKPWIRVVLRGVGAEAPISRRCALGTQDFVRGFQGSTGNPAACR